MSRKTKEFVPKIVAMEMLEKNGVDVERLKGLILRGVGSEFSLSLYDFKNAQHRIVRRGH